MGIASFSPIFSRLGSPRLSILFAPVKALATFFMPVQPARASHRFDTCPTGEHLATVQKVLKRRPVDFSVAERARPDSRLKIMREFEPGMSRCQVGRMAISGRMADVCAELDRIAARAANAS